MNQRLLASGIAPLVVFALAGSLGAQDKPPAQGGPRLGATVPLSVQIAISRYQGDKRISTVPYTLSVNATEAFNPPERAALRMGVEMLMPGPGAPASDSGKPAVTVQAGPALPQYRPFGTAIDCLANTLEGGRFKLSLTIEESSPYMSDVKSPGPQGNVNPVLRSFRVANTVVLKDGQSAQVATVPDKISGEVVKIDVSLSVLK